MVLTVLLCKRPGEGTRLKLRKQDHITNLLSVMLCVCLGLTCLSCGDDPAEQMLGMSVSIREERMERFKKIERNSQGHRSKHMLTLSPRILTLFCFRSIKMCDISSIILKYIYIYKLQTL